MNFLEQLVAEWYSYQGYFVRTNVRIGKRTAGGFAGEMDVIAFQPKTNVLVHLETSSDAESWGQRKARFQKKFQTAAKYYKSEFKFKIAHIEQIVVVSYSSPKKGTEFINQIKLLPFSDLMANIKAELVKRTNSKAIVPEIYPLLRAIQVALW